MGRSTHHYLRYVQSHMFGIVGVGKCICFISRYGQEGKYVAVPACEQVFIWDIRQKVKVMKLKCEDVLGSVTVFKPRPPLIGSVDNTHIAVGYSDGSLVLFDCMVGEPIKFNGHKSGISTLAWDSEGMRVASGSEDGEIVVWDMISERGVVRLRGHKGQINKVCFLQTKNVVVSCAKDSFVKFWDLDTNYCFCTIAKHHTDVWDFVIIKNDTRLIVGGVGSELRVWGLEFNSDKQVKEQEQPAPALNEGESSSKVVILDTEEQKPCPVSTDEEMTEENPYLKVKEYGRIMRSRGDRVCGLSSDGRTLAVYGKSSVVDLFAILNEEEIAQKLDSRLKKCRKRARERQLEINEEEVRTVSLSDEIRKIPSFKAAEKVGGISVFTMASGIINLSVLHTDNSIGFYRSNIKPEKKIQSEVSDDSVALNCDLDKVLSSPGHRAEIRAVVFDSIGDQFITASADSIKVWFRDNGQVVRTMECEYPLTLLLPPGDRHIVVGTKSGQIKLYDIGSGKLLENIEAHEPNESDGESGVWSLARMHDGRGFVSGGSDCIVKFWSFDLIEDASAGRGKRLTIIQESKALKVADQVTSVSCSASGKYLAVATLDLKETLYYMDTLKLVHELYGKSMPSTCMDFSKDSTLLITGSRDSCIRIFSTDFGDQKRLMKNCHQGGVSEVRFIANTHLFFSCGHDGTVKQWDADNFERIITLKGHLGIVRCLAIAPKGNFVVSCGKDRSIRVWQRTQEPLILEDEREEERKRQEEAGDTTIQTPVVIGERDAGAVRAAKMTRETENAADMLLEGLNIYREQKELGAQAKPHELMTLVYQTEDPLRFILLILRKIKSSELEEVILILPLDMILVLIVCLKGMLEREWDVELVTRVFVVAVRANLTQLLATRASAPVLLAIAKILPPKTQELQDMFGFNLAGLKHMQHRMEEKKATQLFVEAASRVKEQRNRKKRKERVLQRALLTI